MTTSRTSAVLQALAWLGLALIGLNAHATLGGVFSSAKIPEFKSATARKLTTNNRAVTTSYVVHQYQLVSGTLIKEFAAEDGSVFAVTWKGPVLPNLHSLLGNYIENFEVHVRDTVHARNIGSPISLKSSQVVIQSNGRMRDFWGYAYIPADLPSGLEVNDVTK